MDLIERALLDLQEEKITSHPSDRLIRLRKDLRLILEFSKSEVKTIFGEKLLSAMATCFQPGKKRSTVASLREQAQTKFVSLRIGPLRDIWASLHCALGIAFDDPIKDFPNPLIGDFLRQCCYAFSGRSKEQMKDEFFRGQVLRWVSLCQVTRERTEVRSWI